MKRGIRHVTVHQRVIRLRKTIDNLLEAGYDSKGKEVMKYKKMLVECEEESKIRELRIKLPDVKDIIY